MNENPLKTQLIILQVARKKCFSMEILKCAEQKSIEESFRSVSTWFSRKGICLFFYLYICLFFYCRQQVSRALGNMELSNLKSVPIEVTCFQLVPVMKHLPLVSYTLLPPLELAPLPLLPPHPSDPGWKMMMILLAGTGLVEN